MRTVLPFLAATSVDPSDNLPSIDELRRREPRARRHRSAFGDSVPGDTYPDHHARMYRGEAAPRGDRAGSSERRVQKIARKARRKRKLRRGYFIG